MSRPSHAKSLATLIGLRSREVDRLLGELSAKEAERARYQANLARMAKLCAGATASAGSKDAPLAANFGEYKQGVLRLADTHRTDLALHESQMAVTKVALDDATRRCEVLRQVLAAERHRQQRASLQREQKQQDEQASQLWSRGRFP